MTVSQDVWPLVLPHVDPLDLVRSWLGAGTAARTAAFAQLTQLPVLLRSQETVSQLRSLLSSPQHQISQLVLTGHEHLMLCLEQQLPAHSFSTLRQLVLVSLVLDPAGLALQHLTSVSYLTSLTLDQVFVGPAASPQSLLSGFDSLQELHLLNARGISSRGGDLGQGLAQARSLTYLHMQGEWLKGGMCNFAHLSGLRHLHLDSCQLKEGVLPGLQRMQQLSHLRMDNMQSFHFRDSSGSTLTALNCLTQLQHLQSDAVNSFDGPTLAKLPAGQLTFLQLSNAKVSTKSAGVAALLRWLATATSLLHLDLTGTVQVCLEGAAAAAAYAGLTASTALSTLNLSKCRLPLPLALARMLPHGSSSPELRHLALGSSSGDAQQLKLDTPDLSRLRSCQKLHTLQLHCCLQQSAQLQHLTALQQLTCLDMTDMTATHMTSLCRLTTLRDVLLRQPHQLKRGQLLPLTGLCMLTRLCVHGVIHKPMVQGRYAGAPHTNPDGSSITVLQQLREMLGLQMHAEERRSSCS